MRHRTHFCDRHAFDAFRPKSDMQSLVPWNDQGKRFLPGRPYDFKYDMDDETIYCSELLYRSMLNASGVRLGTLHKLSDFKWQSYMKVIEKYERGLPPLDRQMITPRALSEAPQLARVFPGYKHDPS